jgi:hypothetical protein
MNCKRLLAVFVSGLFCVNAFAVDDADNDNGNWDFQLTPLYYWSINIGGSVNNGSSGPPTPPEDLDAFDLEFKGAYSLNFDSRYKDRWGFIFDAVGVNLSDQENDDDSVFLDFKYQQAELAGYYRLAPGRSSWDILAGARYYSVDVSLEGTPIAGDPSWVDPFVGARWTWLFAEKWKLSLRGDIGGFGVNSDFVWQAWATVDWFPWKNVGFVAGARALDLDYESGDLDLNFQAWGPILGVTFRW